MDRGPWYAMPLARETLADRVEARWSDDDLAKLVTGLLRALAHAHARGILHLDLSPQNVLIDDEGVPGSPTSGPAYAKATAGSAGSGTPAYMAPECFDPVGDIGPWSDLYALGAVLWSTIEGRTPFGGQTWEELQQAHARQPPPALNHPLGPWIAELLSKQPANRPATAAAALAALPGAFVAPPSASRRPRTSQRLLGARVPPRRTRPAASNARGGPRFSGDEPGRDHRQGPLRHRQVPPRPILRVPMFGDRGTPVLWATHDPLTHSALQGLSGMVRSFLRCPDPDDADQRTRLRAALGRLGSVAPGQVGRVRELMRGLIDADRRHRSLAELLRCLGSPVRSETVLVCLDDVQWGSQALHFVRWALEQPDLPVLFVLIAETAALSQRPAEAVLLDELGVPSIELAALDTSERKGLVDALLPLPEALRDAVREHTRGDPLFTRQLLEEWTSQGRWRTTPRGLALRSDTRWPQSLDELWSERLSRFDGARSALEVAAALGMAVDEKEWREVCAIVSVHAPRGSVDAPDAVRPSPAGPRPVGPMGLRPRLSASTHPLDRSIAGAPGTTPRDLCPLLRRRPVPIRPPLDRDRGLGRSPDSPSRCAARGDPRRRHPTGSRSGSPCASRFAPTCRFQTGVGVRYALLTGPFTSSRWATACASRSEIDIAAASGNIDDERALWSFVQGTTALTDGHIDQASEAYAAALDAIEVDDPFHTRIEIALGMVEIRRGQAAAGRTILQDALHRCVATGDAGGAMSCSFGLANACVQLGELQAAEAHTDAAHEAAEDAGSARRVSRRCDTYYGEISRQLGDFALAEQHYQRRLRRIAPHRPGGGVGRESQPGRRTAPAAPRR